LQSPPASEFAKIVLLRLTVPKRHVYPLALDGFAEFSEKVVKLS